MTRLQQYKRFILCFMQLTKREKEQYTIYSPDEMNFISTLVCSYLALEKIVSFYGEMGAGKTTLIKYLCEKMNCLSSTSSPTFSIVNEYLLSNGKKIFHFDFYRIKNEHEALDIGFEEYLYSGEYCFIEWPERVTALLPNKHLKIHIAINPNQSRTITLSKNEG